LYFARRALCRTLCPLALVGPSPIFRAAEPDAAACAALPEAARIYVGILRRELMPMLTPGPGRSRVLATALRGHVLVIGVECAQEKMIRIDAWPVIAGMADD
jgi:hypothetical protein